MQEYRRLEQEEEVQAKLLELQTSLSEQLAKLRRLRQQKQFLKNKGSRLAARGFSLLEEMEEADRKEQEQQQSQGVVSSSNYIFQENVSMSIETAPFLPTRLKNLGLNTRD